MNIVSEQHSPPLILVVDDDIIVRSQLRRAMEKEGYRILEAHNGKEALDLYTNFSPELILLDGNMPVMDGFSCCSQLQELSSPNALIVLMVTALDDSNSVNRAFAAGATDYITKPINLAILRQRVNKLLQQSKLEKEKELLFEKQNQLYLQLEKANLELQQAIILDKLTQIANRRRFDEFFELEWRRMTREQQPLSLILCDIDFFKAYNDTYGHLGGDICLKEVAKAISAVVKRPADLVSRYGGEEFAVILPNTSAQGASIIAEEIRKSVKGLKIGHERSQVSQYVTLSLGVSTTIPHRNEEPASLIATADRGLYEAKSLGRDRVVAYDAVNS